ncbi:hypothetical protein EDD11_008333 [Mortierella claussenii]|nr:hypothetical protein EDD11_008333 [Mortierella claussenii]
MDSHPPPNPDSAPAKDAADNNADLEQHCLLFPTYATRHSRSGSKDPLDWNIRVRGWAFSKRSNRRKRLVMTELTSRFAIPSLNKFVGMARKLAGVTKDNKVYETLESRFGMFLANNTQGARFTIQCIGVAKTSHMELAGDPNSPDDTVDALMDELKSPDGAVAAAEVVEDKARLRKSLQEDRDQYRGAVEQGQEEHRGGAFEKLDRAVGKINKDKHVHQSASFKKSDYFSQDGTPMTTVASPESTESSLSDRWTKGAAFMKGAYRKYKPMVMAQVGSNGSNTSVDSLHVPPSNGGKSRSSTGASSGASERSADETTKSAPPQGAVRTDSGSSVISQTPTHYEDLGHGSFPTVQISSRPGGHFDGTLRVSHEEVQAHRKRIKKVDGYRQGGHPRFLKLHAYHPDMTDHPQGIVNLIDPEGISVISDIDDTIKETNISAGARIILRNTFLKDMQDVPGMADVYKQWWKHGAAIHYVSNSPWQLIPSLLDFFHSYKFPPGSAHLRLHDGVLKSYFATPGEHKRKTIREILTDFPDRKFILIGDSGEIDMEIYAEMAMEFPDQIFKIFIRDITTARLHEMVAKAMHAPPTRTRSFTSIIPKAPINAVTTGIGLFTKQNENDSNVSVNSVNQADDSGYPSPNNKNNATIREETAITPGQDDAESTISSIFGGFDHTSEEMQPPQMGPHHSQTFSSTTSTPRSTSGQTPPRQSSPITTSSCNGGASAKSDSSTATSSTAAMKSTDIAALDDEPMPGAPPPAEPATVKSPLEVWMERVETCRKKLPEGMLTFFEDAGALQECPLVSEMIRHYRGSSTWDEENEDQEQDEGPQPHSGQIEKLIDF